MGLLTDLLGDGNNGANGARVRRTTNQTIPDATTTTISFNQEVVDDGSYWDAANPTRLTIPETRAYLVGAIIRYSSITAAGRMLTYFTLNGTTTQVTAATETRGGASGDWPSLTVVARVILTAGDYIELVTAQYTGGSQDLFGGDIEAWIEAL